MGQQKQTWVHQTNPEGAAQILDRGVNPDHISNDGDPGAYGTGFYLTTPETTIDDRTVTLEVSFDPDNFATFPIWEIIRDIKSYTDEHGRVPRDTIVEKFINPHGEAAELFFDMAMEWRSEEGESCYALLTTPHFADNELSKRIQRRFKDEGYQGIIAFNERLNNETVIFDEQSIEGIQPYQPVDKKRIQQHLRQSKNTRHST